MFNGQILWQIQGATKASGKVTVAGAVTAQILRSTALQDNVLHWKTPAGAVPAA